jgi:hypothetical protein
MATDSLEIAAKICNRVQRLVEAGHSVEGIASYCEVHEALYKSLLQSGHLRSQNDWEIEEKQFEEELNAPDDVPNIVRMGGDD